MPVPNHSVKIPKLSQEELLELEDELIAEYSCEHFQDKLHDAWAAAGDDPLKQGKARQGVCLPVQISVIQRYGFEPSPVGVQYCVRVFKDLQQPAFVTRGILLQWLVNPAMQRMVPRPEIDSFRSSLSKVQVLAVQDMLIASWNTVGFQRDLHKSWAAAGGNDIKQAVAQWALCQPALERAAGQHGFDNPQHGVQDFIAAWKRLIFEDPSAAGKTAFVEWLRDPSLQAESPARTTLSKSLVEEHKSILETAQQISDTFRTNGAYATCSCNETLRLVGPFNAWRTDDPKLCFQRIPKQQDSLRRRGLHQLTAYLEHGCVSFQVISAAQGFAFNIYPATTCRDGLFMLSPGTSSAVDAEVGGGRGRQQQSFHIQEASPVSVDVFVELMEATHSAGSLAARLWYKVEQTDFRQQGIARIARQRKPSGSSRKKESGDVSMAPVYLGEELRLVGHGNDWKTDDPRHCFACGSKLSGCVRHQLPICLPRGKLSFQVISCTRGFQFRIFPAKVGADGFYRLVCGFPQAIEAVTGGEKDGHGSNFYIDEAPGSHVVVFVELVDLSAGLPIRAVDFAGGKLNASQAGVKVWYDTECADCRANITTISQDPDCEKPHFPKLRPGTGRDEVYVLEDVHSRQGFHELIRQAWRLSERTFHKAVDFSHLTEGWMLTLLVDVWGTTTVGYCLYCLKDSCLRIEELVVLEPFRGKGLGQLLMKWAASRAHGKNLTKIRLNSRSGGALRFYQYAGFQQMEGLHFAALLELDLSEATKEPLDENDSDEELTWGGYEPAHEQNAAMDN